MTHIYHSRDNKQKIKIAVLFLVSEWLTLNPTICTWNQTYQKWIFIIVILDDRGWSYLLYITAEMESQWHNNLFNEINFVILTDF